jgi:DNA polymerase-1
LVGHFRFHVIFGRERKLDTIENLVEAFDLETHLIQEGLLAPPIVCGSTATRAGGGRLLSADEAREYFREKIAKVMLVGANIAFDNGVMAADAQHRGDPTVLDWIFEAYERGLVFDVQLAQALDAIAKGHLFLDPRTGGGLRDPATGKATGRYSLSICSDLVLGRVDAKANDLYRLRYAILERLPMSEWPREATQYPVDDAVNQLDVGLAQMGVGGVPHENLHDMIRQARAAWALHLSCMWGLRTDGARVAALKEKLTILNGAAQKRFTELKFFRPDGSKDTSLVKRYVATAYGAKGKCPICAGTGKVPSPSSGKPIVCKSVDSLDSEGSIVRIGCDGTGFDLATAPMLPRSEKGAVSCDRDSLMESGDETLYDFASVSEGEKQEGTYLPFLEKGVNGIINPRSNALVASGRTSYDGLIQLIPREGGIRECFIPRPGRYFCSTDYAAGELCTLAQSCLWTVGYSRMAEVINATKDPGSLHTTLAARMVGLGDVEMDNLIKAKDPKAKGYRQAAKAANFGFPGGMGAVKLCLAKRKKSEGITEAPDGTKYAGLRFCILLGVADRCGVEKVTEWKGRPCPPVCKACAETAEQIRATWFDQWPEMQEYFAYISSQIDVDGRLTQFISNRIRGGLDFCNGANTLFQGLLAEAAKHALWLISKEAYTDRESPLWDTRPVIFAHDEVFSEVPIETAHIAGPRQALLMVEAAREFIPDVFMDAQPALMDAETGWTKAAEPMYVDGKLVPWRKKK